MLVHVYYRCMSTELPLQEQKLPSQSEKKISVSALVYSEYELTIQWVWYNRRAAIWIVQLRELAELVMHINWGFEDKENVRIIMSVEGLACIAKVFRTVRASEPLAVDFGDTAIT